MSYGNASGLLVNFAIILSCGKQYTFLRSFLPYFLSSASIKSAVQISHIIEVEPSLQKVEIIFMVSFYLNGFEIALVMWISGFHIESNSTKRMFLSFNRSSRQLKTSIIPNQQINKNIPHLNGHVNIKKLLGHINRIDTSKLNANKDIGWFWRIWWCPFVIISQNLRLWLGHRRFD